MKQYLVAIHILLIILYFANKSQLINVNQFNEFITKYKHSHRAKPLLQKVHILQPHQDGLDLPVQLLAHVALALRKRFRL